MLPDDFAYHEFFIVGEAPASQPEPLPEPPMMSIRTIVREELRRDRDRKSFVAAGGMMSMGEVQEFIGLSRGSIYNARRRRDLAKTKAEAAAAFPPEYGSGRFPKWKRSEVEAWIDAEKRG